MPGPLDAHPELEELNEVMERVVRQELAASGGQMSRGMITDQGGVVLAACLAARSPVRHVTSVFGGIVVTLDDGSLELRGLSWSNPKVQVLSGASRRRPWRLDRLVIGEMSVQLHFRRGRRAELVVGVDAVAQRA
ncbi:MAG: hypothetical protein AAGF02_17670 [Actinomycetota bacterium]